MRSLAVCAVLLLSGGDERPVGNPSPVTPIARPAPVVPPPASAPPTAPPIADAGPAAPTAEQRAAPFRVHFAVVGAYPPRRNDLVFEGDATHATLTQVRPDGVKRYALDGAAASAVLAKLDAIPWWTLGNVETDDVTDAATSMLTVQRGTYRHAFSVYDVCCPRARPGGAPAGCACPQEAAFAVLLDALKAQPKNAVAAVPPPEKRTFVPAVLAANPKNRFSCVAVSKTGLICEGKRCVRRGPEQVDCYASPADPGQAGVVVFLDDKKRGARGKPTSAPWAVELEGGMVCSRPDDASDLACPFPKSDASVPQRWMSSGAGQLLVGGDPFTVQRVTAVWPFWP